MMNLLDRIVVDPAIRFGKPCVRGTRISVGYVLDYLAGGMSEAEILVESKDEDFQRLPVLLGAPPKFVWIRLGNCTTEDIAQLLRRRHADISRFNEQDEATVLELG